MCTNYFGIICFPSSSTQSLISHRQLARGGRSVSIVFMDYYANRQQPRDQTYHSIAHCQQYLFRYGKGLVAAWAAGHCSCAEGGADYLLGIALQLQPLVYSITTSCLPLGDLKLIQLVHQMTNQSTAVLASTISFLI